MELTSTRKQLVFIYNDTAGILFRHFDRVFACPVRAIATARYVNDEALEHVTHRAVAFTRLSDMDR